jgi:hypothetical protein
MATVSVGVGRQPIGARAISVLMDYKNCNKTLQARRKQERAKKKGAVDETAPWTIYVSRFSLANYFRPTTSDHCKRRQTVEPVV